MSQREVTAKSESSTRTEAQAAMEKYEFGAAWLPIMLLLPPLVYYMWICMAEPSGAFLICHGRWTS
jgi:delta14-sterol reductase